MIAAIYDPAFYLTSEEVGSNMDIPTIVEEPEVYWVCLARQNMNKPYSMSTVWTRSRMQNLCAHLMETDIRCYSDFSW